MNLKTKIKPVTHLRTSDEVVFTSKVSGKQRVYPVAKVEEDYDEHPELPIRVIYTTALDSKGNAVGFDTVGYKPKENVEVLIP